MLLVTQKMTLTGNHVNLSCAKSVNEERDAFAVKICDKRVLHHATKSPEVLSHDFFISFATVRSKITLHW